MVHTMKTSAGITGTSRRQHEKSFKAELVAQCLLPDASVAAVALAGGINANLLFKWRRDHLRSQQLSSAASSSSSSSSAVLVPVHMAAVMDGEAGHSQSSAPSPASTALAVAPQRCVRTTGIIELDIAGAQLRLRGPVDEASLSSVLRALRQST
jgi:transposase